MVVSKMQLLSNYFHEKLNIYRKVGINFINLPPNPPLVDLKILYK
jgi:hypothetical protein